MLGEEPSHGDFADLVPGPAEALQVSGDRMGAST